MKTSFRIATYILLQLIAISTYSQQTKFYRVPGRPNNLIATFTGIAQDKQGYIWLSSYLGGLHRYDGSGYTSFMNDPLNPNSIGSNYSECLMIDTADVIWLGIYGGGLDRFDRATNTFTHLRHDAKNKNSLINDTVTSIIQDHAGNIWVGTYGGLDLLNEKTKTFTHYYNIPGDSQSLSYNHIRTLYEDRQGTIWIGCGSPFSNDTDEQPSDGGLNKLDKKAGKFTRYLHEDGNLHSLEDNKVSAMFEDSKGNFWVGTRGNGLHTLDRKTGMFTHYYYDAAHPEKLSRPALNTALQSDHIRFIKADAADILWIGTWGGGLNSFDPKTNIVTHFGNVSHQGITISRDTSSGFDEPIPWQAMVSADSLFWISSYSYPNSGNLYNINPYRKVIPYYNVNGYVTCILQDDDTIQYISTYGNGIIKSNIKTGKQISLVSDPGNDLTLSNNYVLSMIPYDKNTLWVASYLGLNKYDKLTNTFKRYQSDGTKESITSNSVTSLFLDDNKTLWIGTDSGLNRLNAGEEKFSHYIHDSNDSTTIGNDAIWCIIKGAKDELWLGRQSGLDRFNILTGKAVHYLNPLVVISLFKDKDGVVWAGTHQDLYKFDSTSNQFVRFTEPNSQTVINYVLNIQGDEHNNIWILTLDAIFKINDRRDVIKVFGKAYGIQNIKLGGVPGRIEAIDGKIYMASDNGYYAFYPDSLKDNTLPKLFFTGLKINDAEVIPNQGNVISHPLWQENTIKLTYDQNNLSFEFSAIHFKSPGEEKYLYMLENYDKDWHRAGAERKAYFFNLPPGEYVLKIRAVNPDGEWSEKQMSIFIAPPWWRTWWAYLLFAVSAIAIIWGVIYYRSKALRRENKILEEKVSHRTEQLNKSLENLKSTQAQLIQSEKMASLGELTAGIAHEIQNPLNFVNNFSEVNKEMLVELNEEIDKGNYDDAKSIAKDVISNEEKINHHGKRADAIVKGMLQHSRLSTGHKEPTDINALADEYLRLSYHGMRAKDKDFNATIKTDFDEAVGKINIIPQDIGRVLLNLYNNAFYALAEKKKQHADGYEPTISVSTKRMNDKVEIKVKDNGNGIPQKIVDKVFQPFFTTKPTGQGTGLGLSLSYDIIKAHGGEINLESNINEFTEFIIILPL